MNSNKFSSLIRQLGSYKDVRMFLSFVKSGAFIFGCILLALYFVIQGPVYNKNREKAYAAIDAKIADRQNITTEERIEIINKHLDAVPNYDFLMMTSLFGGMVCICYAAYKTINSQYTETRRTAEEEYTQQLIDFVSGERDEPPNKNE